jgi:hypothetical protein
VSEISGVSAGRWPGETAGALAGTLEEIRTSVAQARAAGVSHFICQFEHGTLDELLISLELFAEGIIRQIETT